MIQVATAAAFWVMAAAALIMGWILNRGLERALVAAIAIAVILSGYLGLLLDGTAETVSIALLDTALAATACTIALRARTYWPMWFAAISLLAPITAFVGLIAGSQHWLIATLAAFWAMPALIVVLAGSLLDSRKAAPFAPRG